VNRLVLASGSSARAALLKGAGLDFDIQPAAVDEAAIKAGVADLPTEDLALCLAEAKAITVSLARPGDRVIGADQILDQAGRRYDKPRDAAEAKAHLKILRGREHRLVNGLCVARNGEIVWRHVAVARLTMRAFSDDFLDTYISGSGPEILESVGAYRLEGPGVQLFSRIDGDYFTVLGLPLPPLLDFLRAEGVLSS
jgi:septum formation protein